MSSIAAIGMSDVIEGYGLAGVAVLPAAGSAEVAAAWAALPADVALVILDRAARIQLMPLLDERGVLWVEVPE